MAQPKLSAFLFAVLRINLYIMKKIKHALAILIILIFTISCSHDDEPTQVPQPIPIGASNQNYSMVTSGYYHSLAIKTDGTLWSWGNNSAGQLGYVTATTNGVKSPNQIGTTTWTTIATGGSFNLAIKSDGTLWGWGINDFGNLNDITIGYKTLPFQMGIATNWKSIAAGLSHTLAVKTDGTLWACGLNNNYQLGDATLTTRRALTQIGTATNWKEVAAGNTFSIAIKTDGTLWKWGALQGSTMSPTQIGTATNWKYISAGDK